MMLKRRFASRRRMTREDKAKEEMEWRKINEDIELQREGVEPLLDSYFVYSTEVSMQGGDIVRPFKRHVAITSDEPRLLFT